jgi:hypothetical protein
MGRWSDDNAPDSQPAGTAVPRNTTGTPPAGPQPGPGSPPPYDLSKYPKGTTIGPNGQLIFPPGTGGNIHYDPVTHQEITEGTRTPDQPNGSPGTTYGGGWDTYGSNAYIAGLKRLFGQGLTGQAAIDELNKDPKTAGIAYYADSGNYGIPGSDNLYIAPNGKNGGALDVIQRPNPEGGGGGNGANGNGNAPGWMVQPWTKQFSYDTFHQPTAEDARNTPGYQFALDTANQAIERSASARGVLGGGGTLKDLASYDIGLADQNYGNVWNRAFTNWGTGYNNALGQYNMARDQFFANQDRPFNKNQALAGLGQVATSNLDATGPAYVNTAAGLYTGAGNAAAAGTVGSANAYGSALSIIGNIYLAQQYFSSFQ